MWGVLGAVSRSWVYLVKCWGWKMWQKLCVCVLGCLGIIKIRVWLNAGTALCLERRSDVSGQGTVILTGNGYGSAGRDREGPWV